ncbi:MULTISPECIES: DUF4287 domain-containing protein [unclassified Frigoribacterium]|uniref:DUF4287 domain-containing protein n=1 Tax=unclassified Frigoribacterium TaxID=2627005 RepID=UPI0006FD322D|nr:MULTISPECIES: DUF4287 domain-containing protein [unclassified Frigoribacterium]KQO47834.1 hypothetical protein ASF07_10480 [Frigoribacterium sp. Leaf254]KQT39927.1 hypothetical protein ASG28_10485 [Frigoribacterium sp. Leaf415]
MAERRVLAPDPPVDGQKVTGPASYFPSIERTHGRPIQQWLDLTAERLDEDEHTHMQVVSWLKSEHGLGHGHANAIVAYVRHARG